MTPSVLTVLLKIKLSYCLNDFFFIVQGLWVSSQIPLYYPKIVQYMYKNKNCMYNMNCLINIK